jgi:NMD protein affecting ribosome stability and mRNA decay
MMKGDGGIATGMRRRDRLIQEKVHDSYMAVGKPEEPTVCRDCGVVFHQGRWQWLPEPPAQAVEAVCPACRRTQDRVPAGFLTLSGEFFQEHRDEIMNLVENTVASQEKEHPMKRLMRVEDRDDGAELTFTDSHLPHGVGEAIQRAYDGELDIHFPEEGGIVRVYWER